MSFVLDSTMASVTVTVIVMRWMGGVPFPWTGTVLVFAFLTFAGKVSKVPLKFSRGEYILHGFL